MGEKTVEPFDDDTAGLPDGEDDLTATLRDEMGKLSSEHGDDDNGGFDAPLENDSIKSKDVVGEEEGIKRIQDAKDNDSAPSAKKNEPDLDADGKPVEAKPDDPLADGKPAPKAEADDPTADTKPEPKASDDSSGGDPEADIAVASDDDYKSAIGGLSPSVQKRIAQERQAYDDVMAPFKGREAQLEALGIDTKGAVKWFVDTNDYAQRDPGGYLAWVVNQASHGDTAKVEKVLQDAASKLGYKVEKDTGDASGDDDDDPFMSDRERELLEENRQLKAGQSQPVQDYGPDSQAEKGRRAVQEVISEVGEDGMPMRPNFELLQPTILAIVKAEVQASGVPMTAESLREAYNQAELAHPQTRADATQRLLAAQPQPDVAQQAEKNAAALAKAKTASKKIIDGSGQSASHQPAKTDPDMGITDFLRSQMSGGS